MKSKFTILSFLAVMSASFALFGGGKDTDGNPLTRETLFGVIDGDVTTAGDIADLNSTTNTHGYFCYGTNSVSPSSSGVYNLVDNKINKIIIASSPTLDVDLVCQDQHGERLVALTEVEFGYNDEYISSTLAEFNPDHVTTLGEGTRYLPSGTISLFGDNWGCYYYDYYMVDDWNVSINFEMYNTSKDSVKNGDCNWSCSLYLERPTEYDWEYENYYWYGNSSCGQKVVIQLPQKGDIPRDFILDFTSSEATQIEFLPKQEISQESLANLSQEESKRYVHFIDRPGDDGMVAYDLLDFSRGSITNTTVKKEVVYTVQSNEVTVVVSNEYHHTEHQVINNTSTTTVEKVSHQSDTEYVVSPTNVDYKAGEVFIGLSISETNITVMPHTNPQPTLQIQAPKRPGQDEGYSCIMLGTGLQSVYSPLFTAGCIWIPTLNDLRFTGVMNPSNFTDEAYTLAPMYSWWQSNQSRFSEIMDWYSTAFSGSTFRHFGDIYCLGNIICEGTLSLETMAISRNISCGGAMTIGGHLTAEGMYVGGVYGNPLDGLVSYGTRRSARDEVNRIVENTGRDVIRSMSTDVLSDLFFKPTDNIIYNKFSVQYGGNTRDGYVVKPVNNTTMYLNMWDGTSSNARDLYLEAWPVQRKDTSKTAVLEKNPMMFRILVVSDQVVHICLDDPYSTGYKFTYDSSRQYGWRVLCENTSTIFADIPANTPTLITFTQSGTWNGWPTSMLTVKREALQFYGQNQ